MKSLFLYVMPPAAMFERMHHMPCFLSAFLLATSPSHFNTFYETKFIQVRGVAHRLVESIKEGQLQPMQRCMTQLLFTGLTVNQSFFDISHHKYSIQQLVDIAITGYEHGQSSLEHDKQHGNTSFTNDEPPHTHRT